MSENKTQFRVASFGGFNKEDVMQYIEELDFNLQQSKEKNNLEVVRLRKESEEFKSICSENNLSKETLGKFIKESVECEERLENLQENHKSTGKENARLKEKIKTLTEENEQLTSVVRVKSSNIDDQVKSLINENKETQEENKKLHKQIAEFEKIKETVIKLELDAHIRAKSVLDEAKAKAQAIIDEVTAQADAKIKEADDKFAIVIKENMAKCTEIKENTMVKVLETVDIQEKIKNQIEVLKNQSSEIEKEIETYVDFIKCGFDKYENCISEKETVE